MLLISLSKKHGRARFFHTQNSTYDLKSLCMLFLEGGCSSSVNVFKRGKGNHLLLVFILFSKLTLFYELLNRGVSIFRGARNAIFSLDDQQAGKGAVTLSRFT